MKLAEMVLLAAFEKGEFCISEIACKVQLQGRIVSDVLEKLEFPGPLKALLQ